MSEFSIKDAALSGFRLTQKNPVLLVVLALFSIVLSLALSWFTVFSAGPAMAQLRDMQTSGAPDPTLAMRLMGQVFPVIILSIVISVIMFVVNAGAVTRAVVRPEDSAVPYIRFGGDEFRLLMMSIVVGILMGVLYMICALLITVAMFTTLGATGGMQQMAENPGQLPVAAQITTGIGGFLTAVVLFLFGAKFAFAPSQTVRDKATRVFASWGLTKGRYWRVVGAYLLAVVFLLPFVVLGCAILGAVAATTPEGVAGMMKVFQPDYGTMQAAFSPLMLTYYVVAAVLGALGSIVLLGAAAYIYDKIADVEDEEVF